MCRDFTQTTDSGTYRNGFSTDPDVSSTLISILSFVNRALRIFAMVGYEQGTSSQQTTSGEFQYLLPSGNAGRIVEVTFGSGVVVKTLTEDTLQNLAARDPMWRLTQGSPALYITLGPHLWVYPVPPWSRTLAIRHTTAPEDLVNPTDVPTLLPYYHDGVALLAAGFMLSSDAENPSNMARLEFILAQFSIVYADADKMIRARSLLLPRSRIEGGRKSVDQEI